jgi:hypothetical protein
VIDEGGVRDESVRNEDERAVVKLELGLEDTVRYPEELSVSLADCVPEVDAHGDDERTADGVFIKEGVLIAEIERRLVTLAVVSAVSVWTCVLAAVSLGALLCDASNDGVA